jgi:transposase
MDQSIIQKIFPPCTFVGLNFDDNNLLKYDKEGLFVFRGKKGDKLKILWWDGQGFCLYYKCMDKGKFAWLKTNEVGVVGITKGQLAMLLEGIDWRNPIWSNKPTYS